MQGMDKTEGEASKGSQKWIQRAVEESWQTLTAPILNRLGDEGPIGWVSPLRSEKFIEYRDADFLRRIGHPELEGVFKEHWPQRGPVWDALGRTDRGNVLLVEAKAHIGELCSPGTAASPESRVTIEKTLDRVAQQLGASRNGAHWGQFFYQLANRIAHLAILREHGVQAWLVLVNFLNDQDMKGPSSEEVWEAAYQVAYHVMGLPRRHKLSSFVIDVYPDTKGR